MGSKQQHVDLASSEAVKPNPGSKLSRNFLPLMFCVLSSYSNSKAKAKLYEHKISSQSYKTQIQILAYPGLGE